MCAAAQVSKAIRWCGMQLLGNKRLMALSRSTRAGVHRADSSLEEARRLVAVAQQAGSGLFVDVRAFQCAVKKAVQKTTSQPMLSAVMDCVDCWCYSIAKSLQL